MLVYVFYACMLINLCFLFQYAHVCEINQTPISAKQVCIDISYFIMLLCLYMFFWVIKLTLNFIYVIPCFVLDSGVKTHF